MNTWFRPRTSRPAALALLGLAAITACSSGGRDGPNAFTPSGWPVARAEATVSSVFGAQRRRSRHQGIDLSAPKKARVETTAAGRVVFAGSSGDYGRMVVIDHGNGLETLYAHLARISVRAGEKVERGDLVGRVGKSGNATGYHLHYEVRRGGRPVDPRPFMDG